MKVIARNKRSRYDYEIKENFISGISLLGSEVKSIKLGNVNIEGSFVSFDKKNNLLIYGMNVSKYEFQNIGEHDPLRSRQLLLNKREIRKINDKIKLERLSVVPTKVFVNNKGIIKIELGIGRGRKKHDKREYKKELEFQKLKKEYI